MTRFLVIVFCILFSMAAMSKDVSKDKSKHLSTHKIQTSKKIANAKVVRKKLPLLTVAQYKKLSTNNRKLYVRYMRAAWVSFEKTYILSQKIPVVWFQGLLWESAYAAEGKCIIGGVVLDTVGGKCPTRGEATACTGEGIADGFKCGSIFGGVCVSRAPIQNLSDRCSQESAPLPSPVQYEKLVQNLQENYEAVCANPSKNTEDGCRNLNLKIIDSAKSVGAEVKTRDELDALVNIDFGKNTARSNDEVCENAENATVQPKTPKFSFERRCLFDRNKKYLSELAGGSCEDISKNASEKLFATQIQYDITSPESSSKDVIIIESIEDKKPADINEGKSVYLYDIQYIKPARENGNGSDIVSRGTIEVMRIVYNSRNCDSDAKCDYGQSCNEEKKCEQLTTLLGASGKSSTIRMTNIDRSKLGSESGRVESEKNLYNVDMLRDCSLVEALNAANYYNKPASPSGSDRIFKNGADGSR